jgi:hypothetical protein
VIAFYGALLDLREMSTEAMHGRATLDVNARAIAERFRHMALNLADALDGLGKDRPFLHSQDTRKLFMPNGESVASIKPLPRTLQELLRAVGGQAHSARRDPNSLARHLFGLGEARASARTPAAASTAQEKRDNGPVRDMALGQFQVPPDHFRVHGAPYHRQPGGADPLTKPGG